MYLILSPSPRSERPASTRGQQGIVLLIALIMLVAMSLAGIAVVRSVFTGNLIAGNLAFQQAATASGDAGIEEAITWLESNSTLLNASNTALGYSAAREDPDAGASWATFWTQLQAANRVRTLSVTPNAAGNTVAYVIHRMCASVGDPASGIGCSVSPSISVASGSTKGAGVPALNSSGQVYYRITARVAGPRNTVSFVQAMVAM